MALTRRELESLLEDGNLVSPAVWRPLLAPLPPTADAEGVLRVLVEQRELTKHQAACLFQGKAEGLVVGEYIVLDKLGQGGMGIVYRAQHRRLKRIVAMKVLPSAALKDPERVQRFYREAEAAARLTHPNIVRAYDAGEAAGKHYLTMEYVEGEDLHRAAKGRMPWRDAVACMVQAARGLDYAHRQGVFHRDIKPSNLLRDKNGALKILDMGLARIAGDQLSDAEGVAGAQLTQSGQIMGTVDYMSPEQAEDTRCADGRSDIYSLGCTLYRLVAGAPPFDGDTIMKRLLAHRSSPIPSLRKGSSEIPESLDVIFRKMVAKRPEDRFATMNEVADALEACLAGQPLPEHLARGASVPLPAETIDLVRAAPALGGTPALAASSPGPAIAETIQLPEQIDTDRMRAHEETPARPYRKPPPRRSEAKTVAEEGSPAPTPPPCPSELAPAEQPWAGLISRPPWEQPWPIQAGLGGGVALLLAVVALAWYLTRPPATDGPPVAEVPKGTASAAPLDPAPARPAPRPAPSPAAKAAPKASPPSPGTMPLPLAPAGFGRGARSNAAQASTIVKYFGNRPRTAPAQFTAAEAKKLQAAWAQQLAVPPTFTNSLGVKLVLIPESEYTASRTAYQIAPFYIAEQELTVGQFRKFVEETGYRSQAERDGQGGVAIDAKLSRRQASDTNWRNPQNDSGDNFPVQMLSYRDGLALCQELSKRENRRYDLPASWEWELACRAGTATKYSFGNTLGHNLAAYGDPSLASWAPLPVGSFAPNQYGLYDMHGNLAEWIVNRQSANVTARCVGGGIWSSTPEDFVSAATRPPNPAAGPPGQGGESNFGLRLVCRIGAYRPDKQLRPAALLPTIEDPFAGLGLEGKPAFAAAAPGSGPRKPPPAADVPAEPAKAPFAADIAAGLQAAWAKKLGIPVEFTNDLKMRFRLIPPGEYTMGQSRVSLSSPFYIGMHEVTHEQFQALNRGYRVDKTEPTAAANYVTWQMAYGFCDSLSQRPAERKAKRDYRLPTEAEWEYACRAGTQSLFWWGHQATAEQLNAGEIAGNVKPVGSYEANPFGLYDVHGNATEWCRDGLRQYVVGRTLKNPTGPMEFGGLHALRGGGWATTFEVCQSGTRSAFAANYSDYMTGLRVVCETDETKAADK